MQRLVRFASLSVLILLVAIPASGAGKGTGQLGFLEHASQAVQIRYYLSHPDQTPAALKSTLNTIDAQRSHSTLGFDSGEENGAGPLADLFNADATGLPQNEESVTVCRSQPAIVLGGTNDYRGLLDPEENFTGWHFSNDRGESLANEGLLPAVDIGGQQIPSGGDPVMASDKDCNLYAADLNYDPNTFVPNGVGVYKTTPETLAGCPGGADPACWPVRKAVAVASSDFHFLDKPWLYVGTSGEQTVVWVVYSDFTCPDVGCAGLYTSNSIMAVRCDADLNMCTDPILISGDQPSIQFGDVTIAPDGRTYVTWEQDNDLDTNFEPPERMQFWMRVAPPGSTDFGPLRMVADEPLNVGIAGLHANDFRIATMPKNEVATVNGQQRVFVVWEGCLDRPLDITCEEPEIRLRYSDDDGVTWSDTKVLSAGGDNYFPTISYDPESQKLAVAYYTNRFDAIFHNRQDVELVTLNPDTAEVVKRQRLTRPSNETEADPLLGGRFIGDYFEVFAHRGIAYVHFNANYRSIELLGEGLAIPQQDNYLTRARL